MLRDVYLCLEKWGGFWVCEAQVDYGSARRTEIHARIGKTAYSEHAVGVALVRCGF